MHRRIGGMLLGGVLVLAIALFTAVGAPQQPPIEVVFTTAKVPLDIGKADPIFQRAAAGTIPLIPQTLIKPFGGGTVKEIRIRALHDGKMIYLELSWADATQDDVSLQQTAFTDAVALQFPVQPGVLPNPFMGDRERAVNIWQWKASWQAELTRARDLRTTYPAMAVDYYYDVHLAKTAADREGFNAGEAAGNLLSVPKRTSAAEDLVAWGFGTITTQPRQDVLSIGRWQGGRWTVMMIRPLSTPDPADTQFKATETVYVNYAVWDGGHKDRNGQKNVTLQWWPLRLAASK